MQAEDVGIPLDFDDSGKIHLTLLEKAFVVQTENGKVKGGSAQTVEQGKTYYYFRGIPYAQPPVEEFRFQPPVPIVKNWDGELDALNDRSECVQNVLPVSGSEDCLYLNVYVPNRPDQIQKPLPVMAWIYGGTFTGGNSSYVSYGPDYFLDQDVMVVSFNYRLGVFGFLSTGDMAVPGNNGLKDQNLALHWIQRNIRNFGGDPGKVTIFGQSAGSASVSYHLMSPSSKGLFSAAIMESGTALCLWALSRNNHNAIMALGEILGFNTSSSEALVENLRRVDYKRLQIITSTGSFVDKVVSNPLNGLIPGPVIEVEHKGAFITRKSHEMLSKGQYNKVPSIIGFNSMEGAADVIFPFRVYLLKYDLLPAMLVPADMNIPTEIIKAMVGAKIKFHFLGFLPLALSTESVLQFISENEFNRPIRETARIQSLHAPTYFYEFTHQGNLSGVSDRKVSGVHHSEELSYLWRRNKSASDADVLCRTRMIKLWTNFAKYRNPTPPSDAKTVLSTLTWPTASSVNSKDSSPDTALLYLEIGKELTVKQNPREKNWKFWTNLYNQYGHPPYDTY